jgi:Domain of unknown function (DUF5680)
VLKQKKGAHTMECITQETLEPFIVRAKQSTYVGGSSKLLPYRLGSKDLQFREGDWIYHDSYLGESDFIGQEIVYYQLKPVWGMNYFGVIIKPDKITSSQAGQMIMKSLSRLYMEGRFLGGFEHQEGPLRYVDQNTGNVRSFQGREYIALADEVIYELFYHGGLLQD